MAKEDSILLIHDTDKYPPVKDAFVLRNAGATLKDLAGAKEAYHCFKISRVNPLLILPDTNLAGTRILCWLRWAIKTKRLKRITNPFVFFAASVTGYAVNEDSNLAALLLQPLTARLPPEQLTNVQT